jgi:hypothetical protein
MRAATASCTLPVPRSGRLERCPGLWQCLGAVRGRAGRQGPFPAIRLMPLRPSRHFWRLTNLPLLAARSILSPAFGPLSRPAGCCDPRRGRRRRRRRHGRPEPQRGEAGPPRPV